MATVGQKPIDSQQPNTPVGKAGCSIGKQKTSMCAHHQIPENMLTDFLIQHVDFSTEELEIITDKFERQTLAKNELFLREGEICTKVAFVESGTLVLSQTLDTGDEHILDFFVPGNLISDYYSLKKNLPAVENQQTAFNKKFPAHRQSRAGFC